MRFIVSYFHPNKPTRIPRSMRYLTVTNECLYLTFGKKTPLNTYYCGIGGIGGIGMLSGPGICGARRF